MSGYSRPYPTTLSLTWPHRSNWPTPRSLRYAQYRRPARPERARFTGSADVGDADADLITGGLLLDVKASTKATAGRKEFYQLIGYVLLDYDDRYRIDSVGLYLSRFGRLITWTVTDYLRLLGCRQSLVELREGCTAALSAP
ncbi:hypothetical protein AB0H88_21450 [Nonomuraea sp. NPDC050680]|uniref:hypothetical protein n=1 Tax=Nonomuraea sp. NPDC050680 TaxID=3154630 RepID=UPI00340CD050